MLQLIKDIHNTLDEGIIKYTSKLAKDFSKLFRDSILKVRDEVMTGQRLQDALPESGLFPHMVIQMISIGEESGALDELLSKVADFYEEEVDNLVDNLSSLMEPMIMMILGVLVGGLIVAMYLPIFKLGEVIH